jgi:ribosome-associated protein
VKIKISGTSVCRIRGEFIRLDALLKFENLAESGGEAKRMIQDGEVFVNGEPTTARGNKIREGDIVRAAGRRLRVETEKAE